MNCPLSDDLRRISIGVGSLGGAASQSGVWSFAGGLILSAAGPTSLAPPETSFTAVLPRQHRLAGLIGLVLGLHRAFGATVNAGNKTLQLLRAAITQPRELITSINVTRDVTIVITEGYCPVSRIFANPDRGWQLILARFAVPVLCIHLFHVRPSLTLRAIARTSRSAWPWRQHSQKKRAE